LAKLLSDAAASSAATAGKELAVVLADPVGYTAELNELRLKRQTVIEEYLHSKPVQHPLESISTVNTMRQVLEEESMKDLMEVVRPIVSSSYFEKSKEFDDDCVWHPLDAAEKKALLEADSSFAEAFMGNISKNDLANNPDPGRVQYPDHHVRVKELIDKKVAERWEKLSKSFRLSDAQDWYKQHQINMQDLHLTPLAKYENDWLLASKSPLTIAYFEHHFNENAPNKVEETHCTGLTYCAESFSINQPAPYSKQHANGYLRQHLDHDEITQNAVALRALFANQKNAFTTAFQALTRHKGDLAAVKAADKALYGESETDNYDGLRDKSYDIMKGIANLTETGVRRYSWLGDMIVFFSGGQLTAISAAIAQAADHAAGSHGNKPLSEGLKAQLKKVQNLWLYQHCIKMAKDQFNEIALPVLVGNGKEPVVPILITKRVLIGTLLQEAELSLKLADDYTREQLEQQRKKAYAKLRKKRKGQPQCKCTR
jgi:hypothetical protein